MPTTYYHTVDGEIQGQTTAGVRTDYLTDALGSVVATVNSSAQVVNTYRYKPYGERLAKTGVGADPRFLWTGDTGSRRTERSFADQYNLARHISTQTSTWTTRDRLWAHQQAYNYAYANPVTLYDFTGLEPISVRFSAFLHKDLNTRYGAWLPFEWFQQYLLFIFRRYSHYSGDNRGFGDVGTSRLSTRTSIDSCSIWRAPSLRTIQKIRSLLRLMMTRQIRGAGRA